MEKDYNIMKKDVIILIAEDDEGHSALIKKNLKRSGISNQTLSFKDGEEIIDFLFDKNVEYHYKSGYPYLLLLDIRMPKIDGVEVLKRIKADEEFKKLPVIMLTTTDDPREIENCHSLGCNSYIAKPVDYDKFVDAIKKLGLYLSVVEVPAISGDII